MGGRGASSGMSYDKHGNPKHKYGMEYSTIYQSGNIKFVKCNMNGAMTAPLETMTSGRVYATVNEKTRLNILHIMIKITKEASKLT